MCTKYLILGVEFLVPLVGNWIVRIAHICAVLPEHNRSWMFLHPCWLVGSVFELGDASPVHGGLGVVHDPGGLVEPGGWFHVLFLKIDASVLKFWESFTSKICINGPREYQ